MGQGADDILNGDVDSITGEWLGDGQGYPRTNERCNGVHYYERKRKLAFKNPPYTWWKKANGRRVRVANMSYKYVCNCIKKIDREGNWRTQWRQPLLDQLELISNKT